MSMKIKTALDMQGNGIENFLIQGVSAIEGLSDKSLGRKILYTGTNTERNYREMIYIGNSIGGDGWRTTAYMSDVDELRGLITALENATDEEIEALKGRATTTEGNLATLRSEFDALNKALNEDTAGTIDTWNEIQNFVGKYDGSEDLETILSRMNAEIDTKLNKTGGTISGDLEINKENGESTLILGTNGRVIYNPTDGSMSLYNGGSGYPALLVKAGLGHPVFRYDYTNYVILHSGNYSDLITTINGNLSVGGFACSEKGWIIGSNDSGIRKGSLWSGNLNDDDVAYIATKHAFLNGAVLIGASADNGSKSILQVSGNASFDGEVFARSASIATYINALAFKTIGENGLWKGDTFTSSLTENDLVIKGNTVKVVGDLYVEGNIIATKEVSAGGAATEGNGGAGGFSLYESWGTSAPTEPLALGANLGYELKTRVEDLELAKTKVEISDTLVSGKPIGAITIDGNKTNLFAPATYAWSEITGTENVLLKSGGTIYGNADAFVINRVGGDYASVIRYDNSTKGALGYIGINPSGDAILLDKNGSNQKILLHTGNVGDYALKYTRTGSPDLSTMPSLNTFGLWQGVGPYIRFGTTDTYNITLRARQGVFQAQVNKASVDDADWKIIAFTDSNVASATKLETARTIWGQSFDGTQNLSDSIVLDNNKQIRIKDTSNTSCAVIGLGSDNNLLIGGDMTSGSRTYNTYVDGYNIYFRTGAKQNAMTITEEGNVNIGTAFEGFKFSVYGGMTFLHGVESSALALGQMPTNGLLVGNTNYGIGQWFQGGQGYIQASSFGNTTATAYALNLNPLGGAVNVGGNLAPKVNNSLALGAYNYRWSNIYSTLGNFSNDVTFGSTLLGPKPTDGTYVRWKIIYSKGGLCIQSGAYDGKATNGVLNLTGINNEVLANFNVRATVSNFSDGRVLIGAVTDDETSALQVKGRIKLLSTTTWQSECTVVGVNGITYYGREAGGYTQGAHFYDYNKAELAFAGSYADTEGLTYYVIGKNYSLPWFTINSENSEFKVPVTFGNSTVFTDSMYLAHGKTFTLGDQATNYTALDVFGNAVFERNAVVKNTLQIGDATLMWDGNKKALVVDKSFASMGEISAGGAGTEGGNTGGGGTGTITNPYVVNFTPSQETSHSFYHNLPYYDVVVQVYEKNAISGAWDMILADVTIANESRLVTVDFGRKENVEHKIVVR